MATTSMTHTPTPWELGKTHLGDCAIYPKSEKVPICIFTHEDVTDAAFIVRAVNCHEELLTQLKKAVECLRGLNRFDLEPMKQAIAKAEGK